eukprot:3933422-Rhodomonas_salina.5
MPITRADEAVSSVMAVLLPRQPTGPMLALMISPLLAVAARAIVHSPARVMSLSPSGPSAAACIRAGCCFLASGLFFLFGSCTSNPN